VLMIKTLIKLLMSTFIIQIHKFNILNSQRYCTFCYLIYWSFR